MTLKGKLGPQYLIDEDAGGVRASRFDSEGFPKTVTYYRHWPLSAAGVVVDARITRIDKANDQAFLDFAGTVGVLPVRRAKHLAPKSVSGRPISISDCVQEGALIRVQGVADAIPQDDKAITVTARPRLMGRYAIVESGVPGAKMRVNPSRSLSPKRAKALTHALIEDYSVSVTIILRSDADAVADDVVLQEVADLVGILTQKADKSGLCHAGDPLTAALRDAPSDVTAIVTTARDHSIIRSLMRKTYPDLLKLGVLSDQQDGESLKDALDEAIDEALAPRIDLPSGGSISIHATPALTAIDVNMGGAFDGRTAADAKRLTNMEAAMAIAYHLKFQNIGGLIVVDFINMTGKGAVKALTDVLDEALRGDHVPIQRGGISQFGLMELSRSRSGLSLADLIQQPGVPKLRVEEALISLLSRARSLGLSNEPGDLHITVTPQMLQVLDRTPDLIDRLKDTTHRPIILATGAIDVVLKA